MLYCSVLWQFFRVVVHKAEHFFALLPTTWKNVPRCCLQCQQFFRVVGNHAENCSNFSSCVFFHVVVHNVDNFFALWTTAWKNDQRCYLHCGKMVGIIGNNAEKWSNPNSSTNLKPFANLHLGFNKRPGLMCFIKKSQGGKSRGLSL